jgi:hypothetical protein
MLCEFVIIDRAIAAAGKAFMHSKSRVNVRATSRQRSFHRIAEPVRVSRIQVICRDPLASLINMVLVAEVRRDLSSLNDKACQTCIGKVAFSESL